MEDHAPKASVPFWLSPYWVSYRWLSTRKPPRLSLSGPCVYIRPPRPSDQRRWLDLRRESARFLRPFEPAWPHDALTPTAFRRRLWRIYEEWRLKSGYGFLIFRREDNALLGGVTITNLRRGVVQGASIGYWIGAPHLRQGYMFEALNLCLDFCFTSLELNRVEAACLPENEASKKLLQKSGFQSEGVARDYLCINGQWRDHETFALLRRDQRPVIAVQR